MEREEAESLCDWFEKTYDIVSALRTRAPPYSASRWGRRLLVANGHATNREVEILAHYRTNPVGATMADGTSIRDQ